jgi:hypothetical protein
MALYRIERMGVERTAESAGERRGVKFNVVYA